MKISSCNEYMLKVLKSILHGIEYYKNLVKYNYG